MLNYVVPIIVFLFVGGAAGVALTFASRAFGVESDELADQILEKLPGINCGACGLSSCESYATAVKNGELAPNLCKPGGIEAAAGISEILGVTIEPSEREAAFVHCSGVTTEDKYTYSGTQTCLAAGKYYNGKSSCAKGCLGFGDCAKVCPYDAIEFVNGTAVVNRHHCWACGLCIPACPNGLISLRKHSERTKVRCSSNDGMKETRAICKNGCIACGACGKKCLKDAISIVDNCAVIDYEKCNSCGVCAIICPPKCIAVEPFYHSEKPATIVPTTVATAAETVEE